MLTGVTENYQDDSSESPSETQILTVSGKVKELRVDWGFIEGEDGRDYFLYCKSMARDSCAFRALKVGDDVNFVPTMTPKGPRAENVRRIVK